MAAGQFTTLVNLTLIHQLLDSSIRPVVSRTAFPSCKASSLGSDKANSFTDPPVSFVLHTFGEYIPSPHFKNLIGIFPQLESIYAFWPES